ncbi:MAG: chloride channel protein, partial [Chlorobiales bacterium]|nr:chloride channel protein [Chlorobiales bacterium]
MNSNKKWKRAVLVQFYKAYRKTRQFGIFAPDFISFSLQKLLIRLNLNQDLSFLLVAIGVGWATGIIAVIFHNAIE